MTKWSEKTEQLALDAVRTMFKSNTKRIDMQNDEVKVSAYLVPSVIRRNDLLRIDIREMETNKE